MADLIIFIELSVVLAGDKVSHILIPQTNAIIEVPEPNDRVVIFDCSILLESQAPIDGLVVLVSFVVVCEPSS